MLQLLGPTAQRALNVSIQENYACRTVLVILTCCTQAYSGKSYTLELLEANLNPLLQRSVTLAKFEKPVKKNQIEDLALPPHM